MSSAREKIILATIDCIAEHGILATSMREIATRAGVALSQIHYYFQGKEGVMVEAASYFMRKEQDEITRHLSHITDPFERVVTSIDYLRHQQVTDPRIQTIYFELLVHSLRQPSLASLTQRLQAQFIDSLLDEDMAFGISQKAIARFIVAFLDGLSLQAFQGASGAELDDTYRLFRETLKVLLTSKGN